MTRLTPRFLTLALVPAYICLAQGCWPEDDGYAMAPNGSDGETDDGEPSEATDPTESDPDTSSEDDGDPGGETTEPAADSATDDGATDDSATDDSATDDSEPSPDAGRQSGVDGEGDDTMEPNGETGGDTEAPLLEQTGNPIYQQLMSFAGWRSTTGTSEQRLAEDVRLADNVLSWQMPHGGFFKDGLERYVTPWDGNARRSDWSGAGGVELGTIDNDATVNELLFLADVYQRTSEETYRDGARRALDFLLTMQLPSGGFPQTHPARTGTTYSNYVTFNDDAMARVLVLLLQVSNEVPPLGGNVFDDEQRDAARAAIDVAVDYILKAQIEQDGEKTVWCAQHDPVTYEPRGGRSYELPSKSGKESVGVVTFLMTQPQSPEIESAVKAAIAWYERDDVQFADTEYVSRASSSSDDGYNPIRQQVGSTMWCRFYDLDDNVCFYSGRLPTDDPPGVGKQYDIMDIEPERRYGYQWGGSYGAPLLEYAARVGY